MTENEPIAVVYLMWMPYGISFFRDFITSYVQFPAGVGHDLYILFNGAEREEELDAYTALLNEKKIIFKALKLRSGQDIDAYFYAADVIGADHLLFLNTYSTFNASGWLQKYHQGFEISGTAAVGATASCQSYSSSVYALNSWKWEAVKTMQTNIDKYKLLLKSFLYWSLLFKPFPNPHLRTNAFMVRRDLFLGLRRARLKTKLDAYVFESGRKGMTSQFLKKGFSVQVVDKQGVIYPLQRWKESHVFWIGRQEGLLISDNQTRIYDQASVLEKIKMTRLAWGQNE